LGVSRHKFYWAKKQIARILGFSGDYYFLTGANPIFVEGWDDFKKKTEKDRKKKPKGNFFLFLGGPPKNRGPGWGRRLKSWKEGALFFIVGNFTVPKKKSFLMGGRRGGKMG